MNTGMYFHIVHAALDWFSWGHAIRSKESTRNTSGHFAAERSIDWRRGRSKCLELHKEAFVGNCREKPQHPGACLSLVWTETGVLLIHRMSPLVLGCCLHIFQSTTMPYTGI